MKTLPKTSTHLNVCGSNFFKLRKFSLNYENCSKILKDLGKVLRSLSAKMKKF